MTPEQKKLVFSYLDKGAQAALDNSYMLQDDQKNRPNQNHGIAIAAWQADAEAFTLAKEMFK